MNTTNRATSLLVLLNLTVASCAVSKHYSEQGDTIPNPPPSHTTILAAEIGQRMGEYMLISEKGVPYATMSLKCVCPVREGYVSVYTTEEEAKSAALVLVREQGLKYHPVSIHSGTIDEYVITRWNNGEKIIP